jgi:hypothetical protein
MHTLIIRHLDSDHNDQQHQFHVERLKDGKITDKTTLTDPTDVQVEGRPNSDLSQDLRWYLEKFLDYPFHPNTEVAERIQKTLDEWGKQTFKALFDSGRGRDFYMNAFRDGLENLTLKIVSDDPHVLAWPWEALADPEATPLAHACLQFEHLEISRIS